MTNVKLMYEQLLTISNTCAWAGTPWTIHRPASAVNTMLADGHAASLGCSKLKELTSGNLQFIEDPLGSW